MLKDHLLTFTIVMKRKKSMTKKILLRPETWQFYNEPPNKDLEDAVTERKDADVSKADGQ
jgi:hypothetical protein